MNLARSLAQLALSVFVFAVSFSAEAQQPTKIPRIGWITAGSLSASQGRVQAFREGLRQFGYVEGKNIIIEWRSPDGKQDRMSSLAAELVHLNLDVIVTGGSGATRPLKQATSTIPIVMAQDQDPVGNGFVATLARPGGNITGLSRLAPELSGKQVELLKEVVPNLSRLAILGNSTGPAGAEAISKVEIASGALGIRLQYLAIRGPSDFETAFRDASKGHADAALWLVGGNIASAHRKYIAELAVKSRLPTMYEQRVAVEGGGLMSYGVSFDDLHRRSAITSIRFSKAQSPPTFLSNNQLNSSW